MFRAISTLLAAALTFCLLGCNADRHSAATTQSSAFAAAAPRVASADQSPQKAPLPDDHGIRIKCGGTSLVDADGRQWGEDQWFIGGNTEERGRMEIVGTAAPDLYRTERWSATGYSIPVANGKYTVRLHFAETWNAITAPAMRVFDVSVEGRDVKDIDIYKEVGERHPLIKTFNDVDVQDGKLDITFTEHPGQNHPEINGIEIIPASSLSSVPSRTGT